MDQWAQNFFKLPMGASNRDLVVGVTELGNPLYAAPNGQRYSFDGSLNAPKEARPSSPNMLVNRTLPDGSVYHDYAPRQNKNAIAATDIIGGLAQGIANPFLTPGRALRGEVVTNGDALELAAMTNLGASMFEAPKGALRSGAMRIDTSDAVTPAQAQADDIMRMLREGRGADVTDEMMAAADQAHLSRIYDLPLDEASRTQRAVDQGYDYARASQTTDTPFNDVNWAMFTEHGGDPAGKLETLSGLYGEGQWLGRPQLEGRGAAEAVIRSARDYGAANLEGVTGAEIARRAFPEDIVNSAGLWDDVTPAKFTTEAWSPRT